MTLSTGKESMSTTPVYFCASCAKPFLAEHLRDRHLRYCRGYKRRRPRSCRACNAAKTKCSFDSPCSRCIKKSIDCSYGLADAKNGRSHDSPKSGTFVEDNVDGIANPGYLFQHVSSHDEILKQHRLRTGDHLISLLKSNEAINSSPHATLDQMRPVIPDKDDFDFNQLLTTSASPWHQSSSTQYEGALQVKKTDQQLASWCTWMREGISLSIVAANTMTTIDVSHSVAFQIERPHAQYTANLVVQSLRCLPLMMQRRETFPWFIHPQLQRCFGSTDDTLPEFLLNGMSIAQMFAFRTKETKSLLWRSITNESQHFAAQMHSMTDPELLAAIQVCMIYLIMYIVDHLDGDQGDPSELLTTLFELYMLIKLRMPTCLDEPNNCRTDTTWADWIKTESRQRLSCLWFLVGCVVCVKNGVPCDTTLSYRSINLPCSAALWNAPTEAAWALEYEQSLYLQPHGPSTLGELIDIQKFRNIPSNAHKLDRWNAGVDGLGSLLNLVGEMV